MGSKIDCFSIPDECLEDDEITEKINKELADRRIDADAIISITQPSGYAVTRVLYKVPR